MLDAINQLLGMKVETRDFIAFAALLVSVIAFVGKLNADTRVARFRETVAFIEKREAEMRSSWKDISLGRLTGVALEDELHIFFGRLELVSLLIGQRVFDSELVYNYWWQYFDEPLRQPSINSWVQLNQEADSAMYEHYMKQCKRWAHRLDKEIGRLRPSLLSRLFTR